VLDKVTKAFVIALITGPRLPLEITKISAPVGVCVFTVKLDSAA